MKKQREKSKRHEATCKDNKIESQHNERLRIFWWEADWHISPIPYALSQKHFVIDMIKGLVNFSGAISYQEVSCDRRSYLF